MAYCAIAMCTDYDSWKDDEEDVTVNIVMAVMAKNSENVNFAFKMMEFYI